MNEYIYEELNLIKDIMTEIEDFDDLGNNILEIEGLGYEETYHYCKLLYKLGYLDNYALVHNTVTVGQLTIKGCEFLEKIRSEKILNITLEIIKKNHIFVTLKTINYIYDLVLQKIVDKECKKILERD